jgi:hypothetical protein
VDGLGESDRAEIERNAARVREGNTNWFQLPPAPLGAPREPAVGQERRGDQRIARLTWQTAYAGDRPIGRYEILRDGENVGQVEHRPQTTKAPFQFDDMLADRLAHAYKIVTVDTEGRRAETADLRITAAG